MMRNLMTQSVLKQFIKALAVTALFAGLTYLYLYPGSQYLFEDRKDVVLSDGTDTTTAPMQFSLILEEFKNDPSRLLYGATPTRSYNAPEGFALWNTWPEKWFVVAASPFFVIEQLSTAWAFFLMFATALSMLLLCRCGFRWSWAISLGLAIAWAFSAYTRARAKVHIAFAGLYHLPLIFLALFILQRGKTWRSVLLSGLILLIASTASHYYLIMTAFLGVFILAFYILLEKKSARSWKQSLLRLMLAALPAVAFNAYCILNPLPADIRSEIAAAFPTTGDSDVWPHPFLEIFAARPLDYLSGDTGVTTNDWFPPRQMLSELNFEISPIGNGHERTNGIRWSLLLIGLSLGGYFILQRRKNKLAFPAEDRSQAYLFLAFAFAAFLISLPPSYFGGYSPSLLVHAVIRQFRVSSRAGIFVSFSVLMIVGLLLHRFEQLRPRFKKLIWAFPVVMLLDFPPLMNPMPTAPVAAAYTRLQGLSFNDCGYGMSFPYTSVTSNMLDFYYFQQVMRGSGCGIVNSNTPGVRDTKLAQEFGVSESLVQKVNANDPGLKEKLAHTMNCMGVRFIAMNPKLPVPWMNEVCREFGGELDPQGLCMKSFKPLKPDRGIDSCL